MASRFDLGLHLARGRAMTALGMLLACGALSSCSSVPDAVNPVSWYHSVAGDDTAEAEQPAKVPGSDKAAPASANTRKGLTEGLPADKNNAQYAPAVQRQVTPTKPLARRTPAPNAETTQVAQAPAVPPKPEVVAQELPAPADRLSADQRTATARDDGPDAPPANMDMNPPPSAGIPETVPTGKGPRRLQDQFQRRLAESAQQSVYPGMVASSAAASAPSYGLREEEPIHLVPPSSAKARKGGGKGLAAPEPELPAASFQVASLDFRGTSSELTAADRESVSEIVRLYKQTGGVVRIVGSATSPVLYGGDGVNQMMDGLDASMKRANAVARELTKRGVPARKIMVGADPAGGQSGAQVYIDVM